MAVAVRGERTSPTVNKIANGRLGRTLAGRPLRLLGRVVMLVIILLWSLFPIYWALNVSFSTLSGADSSPAHYFPSPLVGTSYRSVLGIGGAGFLIHDATSSCDLRLPSFTSVGPPSPPMPPRPWQFEQKMLKIPLPGSVPKRCLSSAGATAKTSLA